MKKKKESNFTDKIISQWKTENTIPLTDVKVPLSHTCTERTHVDSTKEFIFTQKFESEVFLPNESEGSFNERRKLHKPITDIAKNIFPSNSVSASETANRARVTFDREELVKDLKQSWIRAISKRIEGLSPDERMEIFSNYCVFCGEVKTKTRCSCIDIE
jgi:hypothetical protein